MAKTLEIFNPFNLEKIGELPMMDQSTAMGLMDRAYEQFHQKGGIPTKVERIEILRRTHQILTSKRDELIRQAASEGGKPFKDSAVEIDRGLNGIEVAIEEISNLAGHEIPMNRNASSAGRMAYTHYRPRGVVVAVSAFNHPFNLIIHQVITAVAAGCPVIVKPASTTPLSCQSIVAALHEAGLDPALCQMVVVSNETAEKLVTSPKASFFSFIGSGGVGWMLRSKLAPGVECALEHGGAAPVIVTPTASIDDCVSLLAKGGYYHAGQVCVSVQRVFVHEEVKNQFVEKLAAEVDKLVTGDSLDPKTDVGPLILPREVDRVESWVQEAIQKGAQCVRGGERFSDTVFNPTLLTDVAADTHLGTKEVFGPVVTVRGYQDLDHAIAMANDVNFAFQSSIFTNNLEEAHRASRHLEGTAVMVNDHTAFRVDWMPFGGYKDSGLGLGGIGHSIRDMSIEKMVVYRSPQLGDAL